MLKSGEVSHGNEMKAVGGDESRGGELCAKISRLDRPCWRLSLGREGQARRGEGEGVQKGKGRQQRGFSRQVQPKPANESEGIYCCKSHSWQDSGENTWAVQTADCKASLTVQEARGWLNEPHPSGPKDPVLLARQTKHTEVPGLAVIARVSLLHNLVAVHHWNGAVPSI
jgi:hypothetical protein